MQLSYGSTKNRSPEYRSQESEDSAEFRFLTPDFRLLTSDLDSKRENAIKLPNELLRPLTDCGISVR
jgi:hypothetical protein